jgi:hypothetical protein
MSDLTQTPPTAAPRPATWRKVVAAILDFFFVFFAAGFLVGSATGGLTSNGFSLEGAPALAVFAIVVFYFILFSRYLGGTLFQRLLGAR